ncbi:hypothetical protein BLA18112_03893 [Burkholderia lata]|uniref:Uncharacterized protein n=1 Tax=Burkholderia lata (strain ATCC 17760 / DSM 23089 / LMG 22485 / NCIMB 9086 / R18194 / 383) TaxID=482957 RepID=A0A6P2WS60_BURL3|nr:hypothetical protein [Burkholderia lata]VWC99662.1 hypothetical protein BLA18112_03893 [Burkholderia lata]
MAVVMAAIGAFVGPCEVVTADANPDGEPGEGAAPLRAPHIPA